MSNLVIPRWVGWVAVLVLIGAVWVHGWVTGKDQEQAKQDAATAEQSIKVARTGQRQAETTVKVVTEYVDRVQVVRVKGDTIVKEVPVYVSQVSDERCELPVGFVRVHDAAAANELPGAPGHADETPAGITLSATTETIAGNYKACHENAEQLMGLQQWVREQKRVSHE